MKHILTIMSHNSALVSRSHKTFAFLQLLVLSSSLTYSESFQPRPTASTAFLRSKSTSTIGTSALSMNIPLENLSNFANSYAAANGVQVETKKDATSSATSSSYQCAPISLLPNAFPAKAFENAKVLAPYFNILVDRISKDGSFLTDTLGGGRGGHQKAGGVVSKDEYTKKLLELYTDIYMSDDGKKPNFAKTADALGIQRSDYMLNPENDGSGEYGCKQVELNTIASSFAGLAVNVAGLHRTLTQRFGDELQTWLETNQKAVMGEDYTPDPNKVGVPPNPALENLPKAMSIAHENYKSRFSGSSTTSPQPVILFVVQEGETNTVDQRMLEFKLWNNHGIPVVRMSLTRAKTQLQMDPDTGALYILSDNDSEHEMSPKYEVTTAYFRAGYAPTDYPDGYDGIEWQSRELIERSRATKCPQLGYHLAGTKKVQQELARPGVLERFFTQTEMDVGKGGLVDIENMRSAFAGLYSLGEDAVEEDLDAVRQAIEREGGAGLFVLKPQREGGGYNYYGEDLVKMIKDNVEGSGSSLKLGEDLAEFILMQRLFPPKQQAVLLRAGIVEGTGESISEFGCFGAILQAHDGKTLLNEYSGFLLRTKFSNVDEGGVASGFATLSSPYLC